MVPAPDQDDEGVQPRPAHREEFCAYISERLGVEAIDCGSNDEAVEGSDVVVMATATRVPVINGAALSPGCTLISNTPEELDLESVRRADRIVTTSSGAAALAVNSSNALSFSGFASLKLGGVGSVSYTGTLTPNGTTYRLGGGTGTITATSRGPLPKS